jgi:hypothetical protein
MRPPPAPVRRGTELVIRPYRALATTPAFAAFFVAGNALGEDEPGAPAPVATKASAVALAPQRLEPAPGLPDLRAAPRERRRPRKPTAPGPVAEGPSAPDEPEASGVGSAAPAPVAESPTTYTPPAEPQPESSPPDTPPPVQSTPEPPEAPSPDPAPSPAPAPSPDPSPGGGR